MSLGVSVDAAHAVTYTQICVDQHGHTAVRSSTSTWQNASRLAATAVIRKFHWADIVPENRTLVFEQQSSNPKIRQIRWRIWPLGYRALAISVACGRRA